MHRTSDIFDDLSQMFRGFDSLFQGALDEDLGTGLRLLPPATSSMIQPSRLSSFSAGGYPAVEVTKDGDDLVFRAELPGMNPGDVEVEVIDGRLILRGEKKAREDRQEANVYYREFFHGSFERSFLLPEGVNTESIQARLDNGVLTLTIPGGAAVEGARRIPILEGGKSRTSQRDKKSA